MSPCKKWLVSATADADQKLQGLIIASVELYTKSQIVPAQTFENKNYVLKVKIRIIAEKYNANRHCMQLIKKTFVKTP